MRSKAQRFLAAVVAGVCLHASQPAECAEWEPAKGPLMTRWAKDVSPRNVHREYPRPQLVREEWQNLNGLWDYAITAKNSEQPQSFDGKILVPFPIESALSGVMKRVAETNRLWYRRTFKVPKNWRQQRVLLHFGAVDWEATVHVNGKEVGSHRGGYDGFSLDITDALKPAEEQELVVAVWDPTDAGPQPRGKQVRNPHAIWYTPTTGIWQTPWLEPVASSGIESLKIVPDIDAGALKVTAQLFSPGDTSIEATALDGRRRVGFASGRAGSELSLHLPNAKLWSPDSPFLYNLTVRVLAGNKAVDEVKSYFGMRKIALGKDEKGINRLFLNNKPLFQFGPLDQGFWPDGLYTAPSDEALRYDIEVTKELGFNMARKHVKVEPDRWYYWCDKLGLLVWQDMPSGDKYIGPRDPDIERTKESAKQFYAELKAMIDQKGNHPSIVFWVPFNEGWGQFESAKVTDWIKGYDPTRLISSTSGWADRGAGDVHDIHVYPGPGVPKVEAKRAGVLGEYGGLGLPVRGHTWQDEKNWGYRSYTNAQDLTRAYGNLIRKMHPMTGDQGLAAAVYTQTTDVEIEVNGLLTYDREVMKMDRKVVAAANRKMYLPAPPPPIVRTLSPAAQEKAVEWRYTTNAPVEGWFKPEFDDSTWAKGPAGFGEPSTPNTVVRTQWKTKEIWLRREFEVPADFKPNTLNLQIHHDEDSEVYLNGKQIATFKRWTSAYETTPLEKQAAEALKTGKNTLAVHCKQNTGGQYIDVGILDVLERDN
jgi:beta-galactosidase/beta-glucuronidase